MSGYITLTYMDLVLASAFLILNGILSLWLHLGLERKLAIASARMVVQLVLVGLLLKSLFSILSPWLTLLVAFFMVLFAGREVWARQDRKLHGAWGFGLGTGAMAFAGAGITLIALTTMIGSDPWWTPRFALPILGMVLGNTMTGVSLALDSLHTSVARERVAIEAQLLLGADRWQALRPVLRRALRAGFMPIINAMAATGVVSLPGMMTGQILSGVDPTEAVKYQLLVMFLIGGATGLGVLLATFGSVWRLSDDRHRLRLERLTKPKESAERHRCLYPAVRVYKIGSTEFYKVVVGIGQPAHTRGHFQLRKTDVLDRRARSNTNQNVGRRPIRKPDRQGIGRRNPQCGDWQSAPFGPVKPCHKQHQSARKRQSSGQTCCARKTGRESKNRSGGPAKTNAACTQGYHSCGPAAATTTLRQ